MNTKVFYDLWQMECCGKPFKIGDTITWLVIKNDNRIEGINYYYEAHSDDCKNLYVLDGIVEKIFVSYEEYKLETGSHHNILIPIPGTNELVEVNNSDSYEEYKDKKRANGYLIELKELNIRTYNGDYYG